MEKSFPKFSECIIHSFKVLLEIDFNIHCKTVSAMSLKWRLIEVWLKIPFRGFTQQTLVNRFPKVRKDGLEFASNLSQPAIQALSSTE